MTDRATETILNWYGEAMPKEYDNTNRGALFKNADKESDDHPDYTGKIDVKGTEYYLSAWIKTSKAGQKYMSLSVKPAVTRQPQREPGDDDAPF